LGEGFPSSCNSILHSPFPAYGSPRSGRTKLPNRRMVRSRRSSPASIASDVPSGSNISLPSTSCQTTITLAVKKTPKTVRFVDGLKDNKYQKGETSKHITYLNHCAERRELLKAILNHADVTQAILFLSHAILRKIYFL